MNLRAIRVLNGYTQADIANVLGYSSTTGYARIEKGIQPLKVEQLLKLSKFYKVSVNFLLSDLSQNGIKVLETRGDLDASHS